MGNVTQRGAKGAHPPGLFSAFMSKHGDRICFADSSQETIAEGLFMQEMRYVARTSAKKSAGPV